MLMKGQTESQIVAIEHSGSPAIITAGAGAGKTAVMTRKIARLIKMSGEPESILAITFTKKAAGEIKERVINFVGECGKKCTIATYHSFVLHAIIYPSLGSPFFKKMGYSSGKLNLCPTGLAENFKLQAFSSAVTRSEANFLKMNDVNKEEFIQWLTLCRAYGYTPEKYLAEIDPSIELMTLVDSDDVIGHEQGKYLLFLKMWVNYKKRLLVGQYMDFDDLLVYSDMLLEQNHELRLSIQQRYKHVFVDEIQDNNTVQYLIIMKIMNPDASNFSGFGDFRQSIYGFRGASPFLLLQFPKRFGDTKILNLPDNFRSTDKIVSYANGVANKMRDSLTDEPMIAQRISDIPVKELIFINDEQEALYIADKTQLLIQEGIKPSDIGVLYRSGHMKSEIEQNLVSRGIPYRCIGEKSLYEESDIVVIVAFLRVVFYPAKHNAMIHLLQNANFGVSPSMYRNFVRGNKSQSIHSVISYLAKSGKSLFVKLQETVIELSGRLATIQTLEAYAKTRKVDLGNIGVDERIKFIAEYGDALAYFKEDIIEHYLNNVVAASAFDSCDRTQIVETNREFVTQRIALVFKKMFDGFFDELDVMTYLHRLPLILIRKKEDAENETEVELMTVHKSKGLEKRVIFLVGCSQENWFKEAVDLQSDEYEEALRVFYVGVTRPMDRLEITRYLKKGDEPHTPLEFIAFGDGLVCDDTRVTPSEDKETCAIVAAS